MEILQRRRPEKFELHSPPLAITVLTKEEKQEAIKRRGRIEENDNSIEDRNRSNEIQEPFDCVSLRCV